MSQFSQHVPITERIRWYVRHYWQRVFPPESNLEAHARTELEAGGWFDKDSAYDGMIAPAVMALVKTFSRQGHSGMSAGLVRSIFEKVADFKPLGPLTGEDSEWFEYRDGGYLQNKRCSHVFKDPDGTVYDIDGRVFREPNGSCYTSRDSRANVTFPYTPKREYVDVPASA